jgi:hypothetical protein
LRLTEEAKVQEFTETASKSAIKGLEFKALALRKEQGIGKTDNKTSYVGQKWTYQQGIEALDKCVSGIKSRQKKKGEVQKDEEFNGLKNLPRLSVRLCLEHEFLRDCLKHNQMQAE